MSTIVIHGRPLGVAFVVYRRSALQTRLPNTSANMVDAVLTSGPWRTPFGPPGA